MDATPALSDWPIREPGPVESPTVWRVDLDLDEARLEACLGLLCEGERERAARFAREEDRRRCIASHAAMRRILGGVLDRKPAAIAYETGPAGRPELAAWIGRNIRFNLSHSGDWALVAVSTNCAIGVDVEAMRALPDAIRIARSHFAASEIAALSTLPAAALTASFFGCWTRKEAFVKATGLGLSMLLDRFAVTVPPDPAALLAIDDDVRAARQWSLRHLIPAPGYVGAVAIEATDAPCMLHTLPPL